LVRVSLSGRGGISGAFVILVIGIAVPWLLSQTADVRPSAYRAECASNLKKIALGLRNYHQEFGCLPPSYTPDKNGRPMHSWRVLLLPYIGQAKLYRAYRLDEPWNGPNNSKLAGARPSTYACPADHVTFVTGATGTNYFAVVGLDTAWDSERPPWIGKPDEDDRRILLVEAENTGINWMEPKDLTLDQAIAGLTSESGTRISSGHGDRMVANAALANGVVYMMPTDVPSEVLREMVTEDFNHLSDYIPGKSVSQHMAGHRQPYRNLRLLAWLASAAILLAHVVYGVCKKRDWELRP